MSKELTISKKEIESKIFVFRDTQVMLDRDLAEMYQVETKVLNQAVKRNIERFPQQHIENKIYNVRGVQIMLDSDLAEMYGVSTGRLNEQVKRNIERFPDDFMFQLTQEEWNYLMSKNAISSITSQNAILENKQGKHRKYLPYVFTEQGVSGLSGVLKSQTAAIMHVAINKINVRTIDLYK